MSINEDDLAWYEARLREKLAEVAAKDTDWPGVPIGWIALEFQPLLDELVRQGKYEIVGRPAKTNPNRTAQFVRPTQGS